MTVIWCMQKDLQDHLLLVKIELQGAQDQLHSTRQEAAAQRKQQQDLQCQAQQSREGKSCRRPEINCTIVLSGDDFQGR